MTRPLSGDRAGPWLVLGAVCLAGTIMPLSFTGPAMAVPAIRADFGGGSAALGWVVNAFIVSFGSFVMAAGALADRYGRKRMFRLGLLLFAAISLALTLAPSLAAINLLRVLQGVAAAITLCAGAASLAQEFEGPARTRAYSLLGTSFGIGLAFGPVFCGWLVEQFGWRAIFAAVLLLSLLVVAVGVPRMRESRDPEARRFDFAGTAAFSAMLACLTLGIMQAPESGWGSRGVVALLAGSALLLGAFLFVERMQVRPMLDLSLFRYPRFLAVQSLPIATAFSFVVPLVLLPSRFIGVEGLGEVEAGLMMLPLCLPLTVVPFLAGVAARWIPAGVLSGLGLLLAAAGLYGLADVPPGAATSAFLLPLAAIGAGAAVPWGLMDDLAVSVVPKQRSGMAMGIFATMRVAGEAVAIAIALAILAGLSHGPLRGSVPEAALAELAGRLAGGDLVGAEAVGATLAPEALTAVYATAFSGTALVLAAVTLVGALIALLAVRREPETASVIEEVIPAAAAPLSEQQISCRARS